MHVPERVSMRSIFLHCSLSKITSVVKIKGISGEGEEERANSFYSNLYVRKEM